jgi:membrane fusion protein (multidrug efflux system)
MTPCCEWNTHRFLRISSMDATTPKPRSERRDDRLTPGDEVEKNRARDAAKSETDKTDAPKTSWGDSFRARPWLAIAIAAGAVLVIAATILWWLHTRHFESTDDAFIDTRIVAISPRIAGAISEVAVNDNQMVEAGAVLMRIDDAVYAAQLEQAKAQVDEAAANIANLDAQLEAQQTRIAQAQQQVDQAQAALIFAQQEFQRYQDLAKTGSGTVQQAQQSQSNLTQNQASFASAQANGTLATQQLAALRTQRDAAVAQREAALAQQKLAQTNLSYTVIPAPVAGRVTKLTAAKGAYVAPGQALSMFVPRDVWITANFKETQLADMKPGQPVDLRIDAYPGLKIKGHIDSIQAGSGVAFSLLPSENATGNYVKIVQRVPVKIVFDTPPDVVLGPGMSVVPTVTVR